MAGSQRITAENTVTSLVDADVIYKDNPSTGSGKIAYSDLKNQVEIVSRKGAASGYASLDSAGLVPAAQIPSPFTAEEVANAAARDALTVTSGQVGKRLVRLVDTGVYYIPNAAGSGAGIWQQFNSVGAASTTARGAVELDTAAEGRAGTDADRAMTADATREAIAIARNPLTPAGGLAFEGVANTRVLATLTGQNIGTKKLSVALKFEVPTGTVARDRYVFGLGSHLTNLDVANALWMAIPSGTSELWIGLNGAAASDQRHAKLTTFLSDYGGRAVSIIVTRSAGTLTIYVNGVSVSYTEATAGGSPPAWSGSITSTYMHLGNGNNATYQFDGIIYRCAVYNLALSAAEAIEVYFRGGATPERFRWGSLTALNTSSFANAGYDTFSSASATGYTAAKTTTGAGTVEANSAPAYTTNIILGRRFLADFTITLTSGTMPTLSLGETGVGAATAAQTPGAGANALEYTITTKRASVSAGFLSASADVTNYTIASFSLTPQGAFVDFSLDEGIGYQCHDSSANKLDAVLSTSGIRHVVDRRSGYVRTPGSGLSWSGTHEAKSLLGQRALPDGAVVTLLTRKSTAASTGTGCTVGTTNAATRWQAADTFTTAKEVSTLANQLPAGTADADNDIVVDPDSANITASIEVEAHYSLTQAGV